jgi:hypothetical protein
MQRYLNERNLHYLGELTEFAKLKNIYEEKMKTLAKDFSISSEQRIKFHRYYKAAAATLDLWLAGHDVRTHFKRVGRSDRSLRDHVLKIKREFNVDILATTVHGSPIEVGTQMDVPQLMRPVAMPSFYCLPAAAPDLAAVSANDSPSAVLHRLGG